MADKYREYLLALSLIPGFGTVRIKLLLEHLGGPREVWSIPERELQKIKLPQSVRESFVSHRRQIDPDKEYERVVAGGARVLTLLDSDYPKLLKEIYDPPIVLYVKGDLHPTSSKLAVVGTRLMTTYGHQVTESLTRELAASGLTIVSGLARGVDALAHRTALSAGAATVAVLGSGLNKIYPAENRYLAEEVASHGAVISEYPLEAEPSLGSFPARNRIISGLASGVLVTEAGEDSGSLITANSALDQGRAVYCVPGSILSRQSQGTNNLIKLGAKPVTSAQDILEDLNLTHTTRSQEMVEIKGSNQAEEAILQYLTTNPVHVDELVRETKIPAAALGSALTVMALKGMVAELTGGFYARKH